MIPEQKIQDPVVESKPETLFLPLLAILLAVFAWRILFASWVNLIPDECSYWSWSRRLDWSYFDNAGMVAYLIRLSTELFGESTVFSVRFPFLVLSLATTFLLYSVSNLLFQSRSRALFCAVAVNLTPPFLLGGSAAIHDNASIFFWMLALWAAARYLRSQDSRLFYVMGFAAGASILSKYTGVLLLLSILLFLVWNREFRRHIFRKEPWIGVAIAAVMSLPILWWNIEHDWASVGHIFYIGSGATDTTRRLLDGVGYHLAQFGLVSPLFYVALLVATFTALFRNLKNPRPEETLLLSFGLPVVLFGIMAFKGHVEANWGFIGYPSLAILAVQIIFTRCEEVKSGVWSIFTRRFLKWSVLLAVGPVVLVILHAWIGLIPAFLEKKYAKEDRVIWETRGWAGLGRHINELREPQDILAGDSYQLCALMEFNIPGQPSVRYLAPWKRPTQFDVWNPSFDDMKGRNILYVSPVPLRPSSDVLTTVYENFQVVEELDPFHVVYHGQPIRTIHVYRCKNFDPFSPRRLGPRSLFYDSH